MLEIVLLTEKNIPELAKRTGRDAVDLYDEWVTAAEEGKPIFVTIRSQHAWEYEHDDVMGWLLKGSDMSLGEFKEIVMGDIQYVIDRRIEWLQGLIASEDVLPPSIGGTREEARAIVDAERANDSFRATFLRSPMQWARRRDASRRRLDETDDHIPEQAKINRQIRQIRGW